MLYADAFLLSNFIKMNQKSPQPSFALRSLDDDDFDPNEFKFMNDAGEIVTLMPFDDRIYDQLDFVIAMVKRRLETKQVLTTKDMQDFQVSVE